MSSFLIIGMPGIVRYLFYNQVISPNFKSFREEALLMAFDPYTNNEIMELLKDQFQVDMLSQEQKKKYYKFPIMCLLRIKESIDTWEKHSGSNGYFDFIEEYMGREIKGNDMNFSIMSSDIFDM